MLSPIARIKPIATFLNEVQVIGRCESARAVVIAEADRKVLWNACQPTSCLSAFHPLESALWYSGFPQAIQVVENSKSGGYSDDAGDDRRCQAGGDRANQYVERNQKHDERSDSAHHAIGDCLAKRDHRFLLFDSHPAHPGIIAR